MASPAKLPVQPQTKLRQAGNSSVTSCANPYDMEHESCSGRMFKVTAAYLAGHPSLSGLVRPGQKLCGLCRRAAAWRDSRFVRRHRGRIQESDLQEHVETSGDSADTGVDGEMAADSRDVTMATADAEVTAAPKEMQQPGAGPVSTVGDQDAGSSGFSSAALLVKTELEVKQEPPDSEDSDDLTEDSGWTPSMGATVLVKSEVKWEAVMVKSEVDPPEDQDLGEETSEEATSDVSDVKLKKSPGRSGEDDVEIPASVSGANSTSLDLTLSCQHCGKKFPSEDSLRRHHDLYESTDSSCGLLACQVCGIMFSRPSRLQLHVANNHELENLQCVTCGFTARFARLLLAHQRKEHSVMTNSFVCRYCGTSCQHTYDLQRHERLHLANKRIAIKCGGCGKVCPNRQELFNHHTVCGKVKRFKCRKCQAGFLAKRDLNAHITSNCAVRPYRCEHCTRTYSSMRDFQQHVKTAHKPKPCTCGKVFQSLAVFRRHRSVCSQDGPGVDLSNNDDDDDDDDFDINHI